MKQKLSAIRSAEHGGTVEYRRVRLFSQLFELLFYFLQFFVGEIFQIHQFVSRLLQGANDFVELQMHRFGVAVLGVLNQKHHQEGNDGSSSVDDQLPGIGKMKCWTGEKPDQDHEHGSGKRPRASEHDAKGVAHHAEEVSFLFVLF